MEFYMHESHYVHEDKKKQQQRNETKQRKIAHQDYIIISVIRKVCLCLPLNAINTWVKHLNRHVRTCLGCGSMYSKKKKQKRMWNELWINHSSGLVGCA